jgi:hypothetical protein
MAVPFLFSSSYLSLLLMFSFLVWKFNCFVFLQLVKRSAGNCKLLDCEKTRERERERVIQNNLTWAFLKSSILNVGKEIDQIQEV